MADEASGFSIGELSRRTGVPVATLRSWETRYGQPRARRLPGGHRRYDDNSIEAVELMLRQRASGLSLGAAAATVNGSRSVADSVFAGLRAAHPELGVHVLSKQTLLALTHAAEDEFVARASRAVLFGAFQQARFFERSRPRWTELARTAEFAAALADFPDGELAAGNVHLTPLPDDAPLLREWLIICDSPGYSVCIVGWEQPSSPVPDRQRQFETVWTVDPAAVRTAARLAAQHVTSHLPPTEADHLTRLLTDQPAPASVDLERATSLFQRLIGYLDSATRS